MPKPSSSSIVSAQSESTLKNRLTAARGLLLTETQRAFGGISTVRTYATSIDLLVQEIYRHARKIESAPATLVAIGGYGRQHQCQCSDIDLLLLFDGRIGAAEEQFISAILHPLWDLGLSVGHQVRGLGEFESPETDNPEYLVALLEARFLDGDQESYRHFHNACLSENSVWRDPMRAALLNLTNQRHAQHNRTVFHLEPDIKDAPGGLRDATAIRLLRNLNSRDKLNRAYVDIGRIDEAEDFMLRIRSILHMERGRNLNTLNHELQETVANVFGSPGGHVKSQVEALMSTYFHHAQLISRSLATALKSSEAPAHSNVTKIDKDLEQSWDGIRFIDGTRASLQPQTWLTAFEAALDHDVDVSEQVLTCVERHVERYPSERFIPTTSERDLLLRVLRPRPGLYARLSEMHGRGLLGRLFPEFQKVYCHVIRDYYHKYTVDEHTLLTIKNIEHLCTPRTRSRTRFADVFTEIDKPELLILALIFHDVGKWTNKNHSEEGARMAVGALRRIKLPEKDIATVEFLIRHHLRMSVAAFRRDIEDPETVTQFANLVGTEERLKLLCLLTLADVDGVGPDVLTPWKEEMLWRLFVETYNRLTLEYGDDLIADTDLRRDDLNNQRPKDISQQELTAFLEGYPQRYLRLVDPSHVYEHVRLSRNLKPMEVQASLTKTDAAWELSTIAVDQPGLFANICGVLSYFGMNILRGQAMANENGVVLDLFQFEDREDYLRLNTTAGQELIDLLGDVVAGKIDITAKLEGRKRGRIHRHPRADFKPVIRFNNHYSRRFTVMELVAENALGLLHQISRAISSKHCDIELVLISTQGVQALDVFHLTSNGEKLSDATQASLKETLYSTLIPT